MTDVKIKPLFVRPSEAAALIGTGKSKIYEMISRREIPSCRIAGMLRIPLAAIEHLAQEAMSASTSERDGGR